MVYQEQVRSLICSAFDRALTQIHCCGDFYDVAVRLHLHAIDGLWVVRKSLRIQKRVELVGYARQGCRGCHGEWIEGERPCVENCGQPE